MASALSEVTGSSCSSSLYDRTTASRSRDFVMGKRRGGMVTASTIGDAGADGAATAAAAAIASNTAVLSAGVLVEATAAAVAGGGAVPAAIIAPAAAAAVAACTVFVALAAAPAAAAAAVRLDETTGLPSLQAALPGTWTGVVAGLTTDHSKACLPGPAFCL